MKPISKILIATGTGLLFLICILIGVLYYRNLNRNEEEMAVSIERNLKQYLNERVEELNPQFLEKEENVEKIDQLSEQILKEISKKLNKENLTWEELMQYFNEEQITKVLDYIVNNFKDDWLSQFITEAGDIFITEEEYEIIGEEFLAGLEKEMKDALEKLKADVQKSILLLEGKVSKNEMTIEGLKTEDIVLKKRLTQVEAEDTELKKRIEQAETEIKKLKEILSKSNEMLKQMESGMNNIDMSLQEINNSIVNIQNEFQALKGNVNVKVEKWDTDTATLYLVPVE